MQSEHVAEYGKLPPIEFAKLRPTLYLGSIESIEQEVFLVHKDKTSEHRVMQYNKGLIKTIFEIVDNAIDNAFRDPPTKVIKVIMRSDCSITVLNDGRHIPVEKNDDGEYPPVMVFSELMCGSNFDDTKRDSIGSNGVGASLTNIFSEKFSITCRDPVNNLELRHTWKDQLNESFGPVIKPITKSKMTTEVTWTPKLSVFGVSPSEFLTMAVPITYTRLAELCCTNTKDLQVYFQGPEDTKPTRITGFSFKQFVGMICEKNVYKKVNDYFEYGVGISTDDRFIHHSYVNNQPTTDAGSTHTKWVTSSVLSAVNSELDKTFKGTKINQNTLRNKLHVFVNLRMKAPVFDTQNKEKLTSKMSASEFPIDAATLKRGLARSGIMETMKEMLQKSSLEQLSKALTSTKKRKVVMDKLIDAERAGTSRSGDCTLFLTEGDSALSMVRIGMSVVGCDYVGGFPLKGKLINVNNKTDLSKNEEIKNIVKILGLDYRKSYEQKSDIQSLRYGHVAIMTDQDVDGSHITGLILNFFGKFWPNLLKHGYLQKFVTPYVRAFPKRGSSPPKEFYNMSDYDAWAATVDISKYKVKVYKGLGTSLREDSVSYFKNIGKHLKRLEIDDKSFDVIAKVFNPDQRDARKEWLGSSSTDYEPLDYSDRVFNVTQMFETELLEYSRSSILRAIPSLVDGLKMSNRQVMHTCFKKLRPGDEMKVAQLASLVALETEYVHGEQSLIDTIIGMAQWYPGSNNLPLLQALGAFGSRSGGKKNLGVGKDHASGRYIFTGVQKEVSDLLFDPDDRAIVQYRVVEGTSVEPLFFVPNIPLCLINQVNGIATGFRTSIPSFKPSDVIHNIRVRLTGSGELVKMVPWYKGFRGTISATSEDNTSWNIDGAFKLVGDRQVVIEDIPVGFGAHVVSVLKYEVFLAELRDKKKVISAYTCRHVDENTPTITCTLSSPLTGTPEEKAAWVLKTFKLHTTVNTNCFYLLDTDNATKKFSGPQDVLDTWLKIKMDYTERRKEYRLSYLKAQLEKCYTQLKFVVMVIEGTIVVSNRSKVDIVAQLSNNDIPPRYNELLLGMPVSSLSLEKKNKLEQEVSALQTMVDELTRQTPKDLYLADLDKLSSWIDTSLKRKCPTDDSTGTSNKKKKVKRHI